MKKATVIGMIIAAVVLTGIVFFGVFCTVDTVSVCYSNNVTVAEKEEILSAIDITAYTNIFSVNEKKIKEEVESAFPGESIEVVSVVRNFPDNVTVNVRERTPIYKIAVTGSEKFATPDKDFRRTSTYTEQELADKKLTVVTGFTVDNSFAVDKCYKLKAIARYFLQQGLAEDALTSFMSEVSFTDDKIVITLFDGAKFNLSEDKLLVDLPECYTAYLADGYLARRGTDY